MRLVRWDWGWWAGAGWLGRVRIYDCGALYFFCKYQEFVVS